MKQRLKNAQRTIQQLRLKLQIIWDTFAAYECQKLISTKPLRIQAVIKAKRDVTSY